MILLVAMFMLFIVGAMAALAIDVVSLYTARSEAQLAADGAALAGARVLANSGLTSTNNSPGPTAGEDIARTVATQVAISNDVGGRNLKKSEVVVSFNDTAPSFVTNPHVTVQVQRTDVPTFFARIWGSTQVTVGATATAEAYNPSGASVLSSSGTATPVAPICVKPWLLPNLDPTQPPTAPTPPAIFTLSGPTSGAIVNAGLVGQSWPSATLGSNPNGLFAACGGNCTVPIPAPLPGQYYPAAMDIPAPALATPANALPDCSAGLRPYQLAIAACVQQPVSCGVNSATNPSALNIDTTFYGAGTLRDSETVVAAACLIHYNGGMGQTDKIDTLALPSPPFQFLAGSDNPVPGASGSDVLVSDSLVTIPVIDSTMPITNPVTVIGFLQVFLNPSGGTLAYSGPAGSNEIEATIINMAGCGNTATGTPILGNGASPVAVRLISPP